MILCFCAFVLLLESRIVGGGGEEEKEGCLSKSETVVVPETQS